VIWYKYVTKNKYINITDGVLIFCITPKLTYYNIFFYLLNNITPLPLTLIVNHSYQDFANILLKSIENSKTLNNDYTRIINLVRKKLGFYFRMKLNGCLENITTTGYCL